MLLDLGREEGGERERGREEGREGGREGEKRGGGRRVGERGGRGKDRRKSVSSVYYLGSLSVSVSYQVSYCDDPLPFTNTPYVHTYPPSKVHA